MVTKHSSINTKTLFPNTVTSYENEDYEEPENKYGDPLSLEFQDIQAGRLRLEDAPIFEKTAELKEVTIHQLYNDTFAEQNRRLQIEEEQQTDDEINRYLNLFPNIFSVPKRKEIISQIRNLLINAKTEKFGIIETEKDWTCLEQDEKMSLVFSKVKCTLKQEKNITCEEQQRTEQGTLFIGQCVETVSGDIGVLICSNGMGLTPVDIFNDIMVKPSDLRNFVGESNFRETDNIALSIKAYLKFCKLIEINPWKPNDDEHSFPYLPKYDEGVNETEIEEIVTPSIDFDEFYKKKSPRKKSNNTVPKVKKLRNDKLPAEVTSVEMRDILKCCNICYPKTEDLDSLINPNIFDRVMSKHVFEKHNIKDDYQQNLDKKAKNRAMLEENDYRVEDNVVHCNAQSCNFKYPKGTHISTFRIAFHANYHRELKIAGKSYLNINEVRFPCPYCEHLPFPDFASWKAHYYQDHPDFVWKCRVPDCGFMNSRRENLTSHWKNVHFPKQLTCEICGKIYKTVHKFNIHKKSHDRSYEVTCDVCGKVFPTPHQLKLHRRVVHEKHYKCPICDQQFRRPFNVDAHLVHVHGQERKYPCPHCPASFIRSTHYSRHVNTFHADPTNMKMPQVRFRRPNR